MSRTPKRMDGFVHRDSNALLFCTFALKQLSGTHPQANELPHDVCNLILKLLIVLTQQDREQIVFSSKLMEQTEEYERMANVISLLAETPYLDQKLTIEERNLFSVAWKNVIGTKRASWRVASSIRQKIESRRDSPPTVSTKAPTTGPASELVRKFDPMELKLVNATIQRIENELEFACKKILGLLDTMLGTHEGETEACVFFRKMKGDYLRYLCEFTSEVQKKMFVAESMQEYTKATELAQGLPTTHPIRLGLALNLSVFYYEILGEPEKGCMLAKDAFDAAIGDLDNLTEESYKDVTCIMQLLRSVPSQVV